MVIRMVNRPIETLWDRDYEAKAVCTCPLCEEGIGVEEPASLRSGDTLHCVFCGITLEVLRRLGTQSFVVKDI